jgi:hypothetical protein
MFTVIFLIWYLKHTINLYYMGVGDLKPSTEGCRLVFNYGVDWFSGVLL